MKPNFQSNKIIPVIGITMGDPAGVGPEITALALSNPDIYKICNPLILGDINVIKKAINFLKLNLKPKKIKTLKDACFQFKEPEIFNLSDINTDQLTPGISTSENGNAMLAYLNKSIELAIEKKIDGIATSPITKTALKMAGSKFHGHTELIANATNCSDYNMMFVGKKLKIVLVTIHIPLSEVPKAISMDNIFKTIKTTNSTLKNKFGINKPFLAVAGLNPHAGENSMFGNEEEMIIAPAVKMAKKKGFRVSGPIPPDTLFYNAIKNNKYDCIVCMYHDQGLIPFKMLHFDDGINTTIGLPIIRTSCDHGTAYDIAWKGIASPKSLIEAIKSAAFQAKTNK
ncbi:MAG: 4-hydroxythreonine-4-phosphate dehydrogenase PdxA [Desulfobacteraceae bacterium]|nr:4-hydroxythreonine-4-phosphate dehydrogenase PdxA [Desulfobacteraceae bacterium]